jgi:hypothetical protein
VRDLDGGIQTQSASSALLCWHCGRQKTDLEAAAYLSDLRNNRVARPSGARPQPSRSRRDSKDTTVIVQADLPESTSGDAIPRSASILSHKRAQSALSTYSSVTSRTGRQLAQPPVSGASVSPLKASDVVPSATYIERGQRWMEKEEAVSLREAMEDMDLKKEEEEARIHAAAQDEASELVYQHQNPGSVPAPDAPYRYNDHLRKNSYQHARTQSVGRYSGIGMVTGLARDITPRSASGGSSSSGGMPSPPIRDSSEFSDQNVNPGRGSLDSSMDARPSRKSYGSMSSATGSSRRRSSAKRNVSGEIAGIFTGEQIWEEPEQEESDRGRSTDTRDIPAPLRIKPRNPLNRVQFAQDVSPRSNSTPPEPTKRLSISEIHRNPPSQSRNPNYTANPPPIVKILETKEAAAEEPKPEVPMKDGLEIRSDEIRQATSMRLKDRSPKLPTPTVVSDRPGRPIVSFDANWKPKEADMKPEVRRRSPFDRRPASQAQNVPTRSDSADVPTSIPTIHVSNTPPIQVNEPKARPIPTINVPNSAPTVPTINLPESRPTVPSISISNASPAVPTINIPTINIPTINLPTINLPDAPTISVSAPAPPSIVVNGSPSAAQGRRPLPDPKTSSRPLPRHSATVPAPIPRGHWSPAAGRRATATCHQCQLPIEGRVVKLSGASEHFHPQCFICFTCGTGLESLEIHPEPPAKRRERLDRIRRRAQGEYLLEEEGQTMAEDGDARQRFYCHLDFHEAYAPKCKHCKTSIIGEHLVALGENWHYGHFFCAECGDPFEKGMTHIEKDGYAWCLNCQTKRTERQAPKCKKCRLPVIGEYTIALGGEWHEKCFRCVTCNTGLDGGFYPKQVGNETVVMCIGCIERELKA